MVSGHLTDEAIIELYFERSEEAIMSSMDKYGVLLRSLAWNILGNREDVEECVNDTYLAAWNSIPPERPEYLKAYLCKIARNNALDRVKEKTRSKRGGGKINLLLDELSECIASEADTVRLLENAEMAEVISEYLRSQTKLRRTIFIQRYFYASGVREIAEEHGMTEGAVKSLMFRMRAELKDKFIRKGYGYE
ncbi:MAG TPA: RNA polymerase sigma factor [Clostridiaceae bacterium]|jgi:RNA polymerase sigma factor (sigma-70 family)|nr:RNA polymerase sigma factor [Clostridiaceae bacterium]